jgi:phosphoenolpyruvate carboxykinase (ATP)
LARQYRVIFKKYFRWINGRYGVGKRIAFTDSLKMIDAINDGALDNTEYYTSKIFNFQVPTSIPGISDKLMHPEENWHSKVEYEEELSSLAIEFISNYEKKFKGKINASVDGAGPKLF